MHPRNGTQKSSEKYRTEKCSNKRFKNRIMTRNSKLEELQKKALGQTRSLENTQVEEGREKAREKKKTTEQLIRYMKYYIIV